MAQYVDQEGNPLWTIDEAAREWGVSPRRVYKWIKGRDGESKGLYRNRDGGVLRRFSKERKRLAEGSYTLYPVGRKSIYLIRPQPYPEPILSNYDRLPAASHPGDRTSLISYEANSANAKQYGYPDNGTFPDPYSDDTAMYAPKPVRTDPGKKSQTRGRKTRGVTDVEARGLRPLATPEEIAAAEAKKAERAAAARKAGAAAPGVPESARLQSEERPGKDQLPFYGFFMLDDTQPRVIGERFAKFDDDNQAREFAKSLLDLSRPQYVVSAYFGSSAYNADSSVVFYTTPKGNRDPKKFSGDLKSVLLSTNSVTQRGVARMYPTPEVVTAPRAAPTPVAPIRRAVEPVSAPAPKPIPEPVQPSAPEPVPEPIVAADDAAAEFLQSFDEPVVAPAPAPAPAPPPKKAQPSKRAYNAATRAGKVIRDALTKPPQDSKFTKLTREERDSGVIDRIEDLITDEIVGGLMPEGETAVENRWIAERARELMTQDRAGELGVEEEAAPAEEESAPEFDHNQIVTRMFSVLKQAIGLKPTVPDAQFYSQIESSASQNRTPVESIIATLYGRALDVEANARQPWTRLRELRQPVEEAFKNRMADAREALEKVREEAERKAQEAAEKYLRDNPIKT
jgi:hypothetical protein